MSDKESNNNRDLSKICRVCGDKALGYNFNAITCESCKAFFRRNALRTKEFKCPFEGNCKVDLITRRFCQKCRLNKCFDIGMKKEWILSDEEKLVKRSKIAENRHKKKRVGKSMKLADSTTSNNSHNQFNNDLNMSDMSILSSFKDINALMPNSSLTSLTKNDNIAYDTANADRNNGSHLKSNRSSSSFISKSNSIFSTAIKNLLVQDYSEVSISPPSSPTNSSSHSNSLLSPVNSNQSFDNNQNYLNSHIQCHSPIFSSLESRNNLTNNNLDKNGKLGSEANTNTNRYNQMNSIQDIVFQKTIEVEFAPIPIRRSIDILNSSKRRELNSIEQHRLHELLVANSIFKIPMPVANDPSSLIDVIKMTDHAIRRIIKMSKKLSVFKTLCQEDQIALLKGGVCELMVLRSVMNFNQEKECWADSNNETLVKLEVLKQARGNTYEEYKKFILSFKQEWKSDEHIINLLTAITLFTPERPNTIHKDLIKLEKQTYIYLLQRYLQIKHESVCEAKTTYLNIMSKLEELNILNEDHVRVYLDINPNDVGPLLIEIFDLKH